jgi:hypothetical protein
VLVIAVLVLIGSIVLLAGGVWAWGLVAFLAAGILFLTQREAERRAAKYALLGFRERFFATRASLAARSRGQLELFRARRERAELEAERSRGLHRLGHAVFYGDKGGTKSAKADVEAIVERISKKEAEIDTLIRQTGERVQRAQAGVKPTEKIQAEQPPEPARIPEPWPPPTRAIRRRLSRNRSPLRRSRRRRPSTRRCRSRRGAVSADEVARGLFSLEKPRNLV